MAINFKNKSVDASRHAMVPRADVPRSSFRTTTTHKTTFNAGRLIPIYVDEVLPGDSHSVRMTAFCRLGTVLYPIMDNLHLDTFFFFVPNRLVWDNWVKLMGEQDSPSDSTSYLVPQIVSPVGGWTIGTLGDYFGLPTEGQVGAAATVTTNSLPLRAYWLIFNEWFRDQNIQTPVAVSTGDGPDATLLGDSAGARRAKRPDYFTTALPWPAKPTSLDATQAFPWQGNAGYMAGATGGGFGTYKQVGVPVSGIGSGVLVAPSVSADFYETGSFAQQTYEDYLQMDNAYARVDSDGLLDIRVTINNIRTAFQVQRLMERDARGGTRYTELMRSHFGVMSPDSRLQRPEYLGGGSSPINITPVSQQSATGTTGSTTPLGHLSAQATGIAQQHGFSQAFVEHGWVIGIASVRADVNYQQGVNRMWFRRNKYDYYWPAFAQLGEQAIISREIYMDGSSADNNTFGFQERWSEYRTKPGLITGRFRSTAPLTLDAWHLAEKFATRPTLSSALIEDKTESVLDRVLAAGGTASGNEQQILFDGFFDVRRVRPIPAFSTPGLVDHF